MMLTFRRMIHGMRIKNGKATYVSRFVKTSRLKQEEFFGGSKFMKVCNCIILKFIVCLFLFRISILWSLIISIDMQIGDLKGFFGLAMVNMQLLRTKLKVFDLSYGQGTGGLNMLLAYHLSLSPLAPYCSLILQLSTVFAKILLL